MEKYVLPSLSVDGWVGNKNAQMGKLFEHFLASEYSQSNTFYGNISSLKYLIATYDDIHVLATEIEKALDKLYINYYDSVTVSVTVDDTTSDSQVDFAINIIATYNNIRYGLAKDIKESNGNIINFDNLLYDIHHTYLENN